MFEFKELPRLTDGELELVLVKQMPAKYELFKVPAYYFKIFRLKGYEEIGVLEIRIGSNEFTFYAGHIGYEIYPSFRGHHYASQACQLAKTVACLHKISTLYICCLPDNIPSNKTIKRLGAQFIGTYLVPFYHEMYLLGIDRVNIYEWDFSDECCWPKGKMNWLGR
ncbi:MAG: GNAT family N-acetyltransferase [Turicibacter sp.]|nr:GNAT family N-acetyltransferase [Turicibacter sp.]